jgi:hypothetical protein
VARPIFPAVFGLVAILSWSCGSFHAAEEGGPADGGTADGGAPTDGAASDGATQGDAGTPFTTLCTGNTLIDDPFSRPAPDAEGWDLTTNSVLAFDSTGRPAPSLLVTVPELNGASKPVENTIYRNVTLKGTSVCIELDVLVEQTGGKFEGSGYAEILDLQGLGAGNFFIEVRSEGMTLFDGTTHPALETFQFGQWDHLVMRLPFNTGNQVTLERAGETVTSSIAAGNVNDTVALSLGLDATPEGNTTGGLKVHIDNFRMTSK